MIMQKQKQYELLGIWKDLFMCELTLWLFCYLPHDFQQLFFCDKKRRKNAFVLHLGIPKEPFLIDQLKVE